MTSRRKLCLFVSSRVGIDGTHAFIHLRAIVARSSHAMLRYRVGLSGRQARWPRSGLDPYGRAAPKQRGP